MNCHGNRSGGRKHLWLMVAVIAVLAIALWAGFGRRGLVGLLPFAAVLLCPIIHGAMFLFMGKSLLQRSESGQQSGPNGVGPSPERMG